MSLLLCLSHLQLHPRRLLSDSYELEFSQIFIALWLLLRWPQSYGCCFQINFGHSRAVFFQEKSLSQSQCPLYNYFAEVIFLINCLHKPLLMYSFYLENLTHLSAIPILPDEFLFIHRTQLRHYRF